MVKIMAGNFDIKEYYNCDTKQKHNLLIYSYTVNNIEGYNIVIGEVKKKNDLETLIKFYDKIIMSKINLAHPMFICSYIKELEEYNGKEDVNYSQDGYNLLFSKKFIMQEKDDELNQLIQSPTDPIFYNSLKNIIIDQTSKKFTAIDDDIFNPIEFYQNKELNELDNNKTDNFKKYVKVINS